MTTEAQMVEEAIHTTNMLIVLMQLTGLRADEVKSALGELFSKCDCPIQCACCGYVRA